MPRTVTKRSHPWHHSPNDPDGTRPKLRRRAEPPETDWTDNNNHPSHFPDVPLKTSEEIAADLHDEVRRLHHRRQLVGLDADVCERYYPSTEDPPGAAASEQPLFTLEQVGHLCERAMRERDSEIRAEYDRVLREKLSEQYDTFVKFTHDQIRRHFEGGAGPSYLS